MPPIRGSAPTTAPTTVKIAAALLAVYGAWVVIQATSHQMSTGWAETGGYPRAIIRLGGTLVVASGLLQRMRWAWWAGVVAASLFLALLALGAGLLAAHPQGRAVLPDPESLLLPVLCLGGAVVLLLTPSSREAFGGRR